MDVSTQQSLTFVEAAAPGGGRFRVGVGRPVGGAGRGAQLHQGDGNGSRGKLDLRSVSVSHTAAALVYKVTTYNSWTSRSLGADSFFII